MGGVTHAGRAPAGPGPRDAPGAFLTAEWRALLIASFAIDPALLAPLVPRGTALDAWDGHTLVSLVGFRFLRTRVRGIPALFHEDFPEVNLRFYARRETAGETRRGVVFIRELVPSPRGPSAAPATGSQEEFVTEHYWGYVGRPGRDTLEYRVDHPRWSVRRAGGFAVAGRLADVYPPALVEAIIRPPLSVFVADGSPVAVHRGAPLRSSPA